MNPEIVFPVRVAQEPEGEPDAETMLVIQDATGRTLDVEEIAETMNGKAFPCRLCKVGKSDPAPVCQNYTQTMHDDRCFNCGHTLTAHFAKAEGEVAAGIDRAMNSLGYQKDHRVCVCIEDCWPRLQGAYCARCPNK